MENPKKMVTIAGSDILAGGGIQADLATFNEYGYFGLSVITSIVTVTKDDFTIHPCRWMSLMRNYSQFSLWMISLV